MNKEQLTILSQIYNTLLLVNTKGEDTIAMGQCLQALQAFILDESKKIKELKEGEQKNE